MRQFKIYKSFTPRDDPSLDKYLQEVGREQLVSTEEEVSLAYRAKRGDQLALEKLVKANLRFVVSIAKQYQNLGLPLPDVINEGNLGLVKAAMKFDETRGFKFISYAVWWIRQGILQALAENSRMVRLPLNKVSQLNKINKMISTFEQKNERPPSNEEIALVMEMLPDEVSLILLVSKRHYSMDAAFTEGEDGSYIDVLADENSPDPERKMMNESLSIELARSLANVSDREGAIIKMSFGIGCLKQNDQEIGEYFNLTKERVRQLKERALRRLRTNARNKNLRNYLG